MTPGSHANKVNRTLIKKVVPNPWFIKTAKGGKRMFRIIVISDIFQVLKFHLILTVTSKTVATMTTFPNFALRPILLTIMV